VWKGAPEGERELWRGLAQVAVGLTHVRRGNARGAQALLTRAADRLDHFRRDPAGPYGLDLTTLVRDVRALAGRLGTETPGALTDLGVGLLRRP
jgi:predicted metal-dependent hydrolase